MSETVWTSCPIVRRETMHLFECVTVGDSDRYVPFEQEILWIRESEATLVLRHRGVDIDKICSLNDFYGFLSSVEAAMTEDVPDRATRHKIDASSELCIVVIAKLQDFPRMEDLSSEGKAHNSKPGRTKKQYLAVPSYYNGKRYWYTSDQPKDPGEKYSSRPQLEPVTVFEGEIYSTLGANIGEIPTSVSDWINEQRVAAGLPVLAEGGIHV